MFDSPMKAEMRMIKKFQDGLKDASKELEDDLGFLGIIHNHVDFIKDDILLLEKDALAVAAFEKENVHEKIVSLLAGLEDLERRIKDQDLSKEESNEARAQFQDLSHKFDQIKKILEEQIVSREKLLENANVHIDLFEKHKRKVRYSSLRERRFNRRVRNAVEHALRAINRLLSLELKALSNKIKMERSQSMLSEPQPHVRYHTPLNRRVAVELKREREEQFKPRWIKKF